MNLYHESTLVTDLDTPWKNIVFIGFLILRIHIRDRILVYDMLQYWMCVLMFLFFRSAEILFTLLSSQVNNENYQKLRHLTSRLWMELEEGRRVLGLSQHHDAITGTSAAHTMMDYFTKYVEL